MGEASEVIIPVFGILDITGEVVMMWVILALLAVISILATRNMKERPGIFQNMMEMGIEYLDGFLTGIIGKKHARKYYWFLSSLFIFILFANFSGLFPGVGITKYLKAPTSSLSVTAGLGICAFVFLQAAGIAVSPKGYLKKFISPMAFMLPLLLLDELIKPFSLALRLFGNVFGEETLTESLYDLFPVGPPVIMMVLSLLFCTIQAIVFTMLVSIYLGETLEATEK